MANHQFKPQTIKGVVYYPVPMPNNGLQHICLSCSGHHTNLKTCQELGDCVGVIWVRGEEARRQWALLRLTE